MGQDTSIQAWKPITVASLAETVGFEPTDRLPRHILSRDALSAAQSRLQIDLGQGTGLPGPQAKRGECGIRTHGDA